MEASYVPSAARTELLNLHLASLTRTVAVASANRSELPDNASEDEHLYNQEEEQRLFDEQHRAGFFSFFSPPSPFPIASVFFSLIVRVSLPFAVPSVLSVLILLLLIPAVVLFLLMVIPLDLGVTNPAATTPATGHYWMVVLFYLVYLLSPSPCSPSVFRTSFCPWPPSTESNTV